MSKEMSRPSRHADVVWIVPFFVIITTALGFFFCQMAQYSLLPH